MLCDCMNALNVIGVRCDLFGQPINVHFGILRSMLAKVLNQCNLFSWLCRDLMLSINIARSLAYGVELYCSIDVLKLYLKLSLSNHLMKFSINRINKYRLKVFPFMVPLFICIGYVFQKYSREV